MAKLSGSVGDGGQNAPHDVALVQLMLNQAKNASGSTFLRTPYDGNYGPTLAAAIAAFQASASVTLTPPEKRGLITPGGGTLPKLAAALPASLSGIRATAGVSVIYLDMGDAAKRASIAALISPQNNLRSDFSGKLVKLVSGFYDQTGIVLTLQGPNAAFRTFDMQVGLVSQGGPGETIHNYARAVDIGFKGLRWVAGLGQISGPLPGDLNVATLNSKVQTEFWTVRFKAVQAQPGLYATVAFGGGDKAHLQDLDDFPLDSAGSLIALMESVGPRKMKWESFEQTPTSYLCDLGLGGDKVMVGTALDIWVMNPGDKQWAAVSNNPKKPFRPRLKLTKADLVKVINAKMKADPTFSFDVFLGTRPGTHKKGELAPSDVTDADMKAVHVILRGEFQAAAENWAKWKPVLYPDSTRRPKHRGP
jgi:peptidoglycan hydrolase-like protein with peptidoglycan-binding domain